MYGVGLDLVVMVCRAAAGKRIARVVDRQRRERARKVAIKGTNVNQGKFADGGPMTAAEGGWGEVDKGFSG